MLWGIFSRCWSFENENTRRRGIAIDDGCGSELDLETTRVRHAHEGALEQMKKQAPAQLAGYIMQFGFGAIVGGAIALGSGRFSHGHAIRLLANLSASNYGEFVAWVGGWAAVCGAWAGYLGDRLWMGSSLVDPARMFGPPRWAKSAAWGVTLVAVATYALILVLKALHP